MITLTPDAAARSADGCDLVGRVAEHYYSLAHWLRSRNGSGESTLVGVTSCTHGSGVSTVAANLAVAAAYRSDRPVLLVDLTGKRPQLAARLSISGELGLERALAANADPSECVRATPIANLSMLAESDGRAFESMCLDSTQQTVMLRALERDFGLIIVDLPPTDSGLCFATAGTLSGVLLVIEAKRTQSEAALRAKQRLIHANAAVLGIILNKHSRDLPAWLDARF